MPDSSRAVHLQRKVAELYATDHQFASSAPDVGLSEELSRARSKLFDLLQLTMEGYASRPAVAHRPRGVDGRFDNRTIGSNDFDLVTYRDLWDQIQALCTAWRLKLNSGDRAILLGKASPEYLIVEIALMVFGSASVPLSPNAAFAEIRAIVTEVAPAAIVASPEFLTSAVELALAANVLYILVIDFSQECEMHVEAVEAARSRARSGRSATQIALLNDEIDLGRLNQEKFDSTESNEDALATLIYTSGSTGVPKGAIYSRRKVADMWSAHAEAVLNRYTDAPLPLITLSYLPINHITARSNIFQTLGAGGIVYFATSGDLSSLLDDLPAVRPTHLNFVPRVLDLLHANFQADVQRRLIRSLYPTSRRATEREVAEHHRRTLIGARLVSAVIGAAPLTAARRGWAEDYLDLQLSERYGSTEAGTMLINGRIQRPPVIEYTLSDVPELGYRRSDIPLPRGELLIKTTHIFGGYYKDPELNALSFDSEGFFRTGDIVAELSPDHLEIIDRKATTQKLSNGEFVAVGRLEALFQSHSVIDQIFLYAEPSWPHLLAVVVVSSAAYEQRTAALDLRYLVREALRAVAVKHHLRDNEVPREILIEALPFSVENGLLTGSGKPARQQLMRRYVWPLRQINDQLVGTAVRGPLSRVAENYGSATTLHRVLHAVHTLAGLPSTFPKASDSVFDLGIDSLAILSLSNRLEAAFGVEVPVDVLQSPATDLRQLAEYIDGRRAGRLGISEVHKPDANTLTVADLRVERFIGDIERPPSDVSSEPYPRTVLVTGATGYVGMHLAREWLERLTPIGGRVICLVRAKDHADARRRLNGLVTAARPKRLKGRDTDNDFTRAVQVVVGDVSQKRLALDGATWNYLADSVDHIVNSAALVNHMFTYQQLFRPNVVGAAEVIRLALSGRSKSISHLSSMSIGSQMAPGQLTELVDIRSVGSRRLNNDFTNGYANSKWASEVLMRDAHERYNLEVRIFRCSSVLADRPPNSLLNLNDFVTRLLFSILATGLAPHSFYELGEDGERQQSDFDGLPVNFVADAIVSLSGLHRLARGFETFNVCNYHRDRFGLDHCVDALLEAGHTIRREQDYVTWLRQFEAALWLLPTGMQKYSVLQLLHGLRRPRVPIQISNNETIQFRRAVHNGSLARHVAAPHVSAQFVHDYVRALRDSGLLT